jgi:hypothetical protein
LNLELKMITDHDRLLAREVVTRACESYASGALGDGADLDRYREAVIGARWPIQGRGGVAMAHARTQRRVRAAIKEFYSYSPGDNEA